MRVDTGPPGVILNALFECVITMCVKFTVQSEAEQNRTRLGVGSKRSSGGLRRIMPQLELQTSTCQP